MEMVEKTADPAEVRSKYLLCFRYGSGLECSSGSVLSAPQVTDSIHHEATAAETKTLVSFSVRPPTGSIIMAWRNDLSEDFS